MLERTGQTEAAVDLARLAGLIPAGVICEIMKDDGTMARVPDLIEFCSTHKLKLLTVADLIEHRRRHEKLVERAVTVRLPTAYADFKAVLFKETLTGKPVRIANDAGVQGLAAIEGIGTELVLTLGTGMGFALYVDGHYVPNIEMAHHPFRKKKTYEERVSNAALHKIGKKRWNRRVRKVIEQLAPIFNYRVLYLGGGNAKEIEFELPSNVKIIENVAGLLGGVKLWQQPG